MGTSSMYNGRNRSPLLPSDFNDEDGLFSGIFNLPDIPNKEPDHKQSDEEDKPVKTNLSEKPNESKAPKQEALKSWRGAKSAMSKYASGKGGLNGEKSVISNYVKGYGGARKAAKSAKSAIKTTINIANFFGGVSNKGITQVLKDYYIQIEGRRPKEILHDIVNVLAPSPDSNDDSVARKALIKTMSIIYEKFEDEKQDISLLDTFNPDISKLLIIKYIETFIYERLIHDLGSRIEKKSENSLTAAKIEKELKDYIESKVSMTLKDKPLSIINSDMKNALVEGLYQQCYKVLEDQL
jgi:hypothetical protein